jgi:hypothetical protein
MKEERKIKVKAGIRPGLVIGLIVVSLFVMYSMPHPYIEPGNEEGTWQIIWKGSLAEAAENDPGAGASGFLEIFFINHTATPNTAYTQNTSTTLESWCVANMPGKTPYASADSFNVELDHTTTFDILVKVRYNKTEGPWNSTIWNNASWRVNITLTGSITITDATGTNVELVNDSAKAFYWGNVYWNNAGAGYALPADGTATVTEISIEAKY